MEKGNLLLGQVVAALRTGMIAVASLLVVQAQAQAPSNIYSYSRTSSFSYYSSGANKGLLQSETVEPDNAQLCVVTSYDYDAYGNKKQATTANCA
ncbi:hypothetical protein RQP53_24555, partial [Paucibacter sp. APW11]